MELGSGFTVYRKQSLVPAHMDLTLWWRETINREINI